MEQLMFEGTPVKTMRLSVTGSTGLTRGVEARHIGDEVNLVIVGTVAKINHTDSDVGLERTHVVKISEAFLLEEGEALELLVAARDRDRLLEDEILGRQQLRPIDDDGLDG
jgi:hypothetical protein